MAEADELCDRSRSSIGGRILATDSPQGLRRFVSADRRVVIELDAGTGSTRWRTGLTGCACCAPSP
jgi:hypothetical protein